MRTSEISLQLSDAPLTIRVAEGGEGQPYLLLHGGAGPGSMRGLSEALSETGTAILPTHPGFDGETKPAWLVSIRQLAEAYIALLDQMGLNNVIVIGNSAGGWIAAEMGLFDPSRIANIVLLNTVGIEPEITGKPIVDPTIVPPDRRAALAFHDPVRFALAPSGTDAAAAMAENQRALRVYAGEPFMHDPTLRTRLAHLLPRTLILWGQSDGIVDLDYGQRFAAAIPNSRFEIIANAGHFPQIEQLDTVHQRVAALASVAPK